MNSRGKAPARTYFRAVFSDMPALAALRYKGVPRCCSVTVKVGGFDLVASPSPIGIAWGDSKPLVVSVGPLYGFTGTVNVTGTAVHATTG